MKVDSERWIKLWEEQGVYRALDGDKQGKSYLLIEFPYPSGERLHVGHARSYSCLDAVARKRRMQGNNVLFPMGWDAFGLPAENYAVKTGIHPAITTAKNIENAKQQAISWGLSFDWTREVNTTDSNYYKWTQWIFVQLFKKGLAYKAEIAVNWCPSCKINLANEEVIDGKCERCGTLTERRTQAQWLLKITAYADKLLQGLESVDFRQDIAAEQVNWIGRKEGTEVGFRLHGLEFGRELRVFTTRVDTIFGVTFMVVAPEIAKTLLEFVPESQKETVSAYVSQALNKSEKERKQKKEKTGVDTGLSAINPASGEEVPVWVGEYVMTDIGTGIVMGVPAHDERDMEFAKNNNLENRQVITEEEGKLINSGEFDGMSSQKAMEKIEKWLEGLGVAKHQTTYHLRDWVFSRQHYWGEPIPMIYCENCAQWWPVPEDQLPVKLPEIEKFQPTETGESPLAHVSEWVNTTCPECGGPGKRETDTMPNWAGSSWYYLRYVDPQNDKALADKEKMKYWLPVDWYNGGKEHTTLHLLYSRFWHQFLYDLGVVPTPEPYAKRTSHGVVLGPDGRRMSKSRGNVINPDDIVNKYGADTLRMYEMFIGPFDQMVTWNDASLEGVYRFLKRVDVQVRQGAGEVSSAEAKYRTAKLVKKIDEDLESMKFNTAVAAMMEHLNWWIDHRDEVGKDMAVVFVKILAPMAPFLAEELYQQLRGESANFESVHKQPWPEIEAGVSPQIRVIIVIQVDGKVRDKLELTSESVSREFAEQEALKREKVRKLIGDKQYKTIYVPGKIINFVTGL